MAKEVKFTQMGLFPFNPLKYIEADQPVESRQTLIRLLDRLALYDYKGGLKEIKQKMGDRHPDRPGHEPWMAECFLILSRLYEDYKACGEKPTYICWSHPRGEDLPCLTRLPHGAHFCPTCGTRTPKKVTACPCCDTVPQSSDQAYCMKCGFELQVSSNV